MNKQRSSVTIQGAAKKHRSRLSHIAHRILGAEPPGSVEQVLTAILESGLVISAHVVARKPNDLIIRVENCLKIKSVEVTGNKIISSESILNVISSSPNKILNYQMLKNDIENIHSLYSSKKLNNPTIRVNRKKVGSDFVAIRYKLKEYEEIDRKNQSEKKYRKNKTKRPSKLSNSTVLGKFKTKDIDSDILNGSFELGLSKEIVNEGHILNNNSTNTNHSKISYDTESRFSYDNVESNIKAYSSSWTGNFSPYDQLRTIKAVAPKVIDEIQILIDKVELYRFNDPQTEDCLHILKSLHNDLGILINTLEAKSQKPILTRIARKNEKLRSLLMSGAKIGIVSPALTIGISHMLSAITGVPIDSTMVSTVFATMVAMPVVESQIAGKYGKSS